MTQETAAIVGPVISASITAAGAICAAIIQSQKHSSRRAPWQVFFVVFTFGIVVTVLVSLGLSQWLLLMLFMLVLGGLVAHRSFHQSDATAWLMICFQFSAAIGVIAWIVTHSIWSANPQIPRPGPSPAPDRVRQWHDLLPKLCRGNEKKGYTIRSWNYPEWIRGQKGLYLEITIYSITSKPLIFDATKYMIPPEQNDKFDVSVNNFVEEVIWPLERLGFTEYVYVRGRADHPTFDAKLVDPAFRGKISLLRPLSEIQYSDTETVFRFIGETYQNDDLPALRALYLQRILAAPNHGVQAKILDGLVTKNTNPAERNAVIVLFVEMQDWVIERNGSAPCKSSE